MLLIFNSRSTAGFSVNKKALLDDGVVEILNSEKKELAPVDFTELYANAADIKEAALVEPQALLVNTHRMLQSFGILIKRQFFLDQRKTGFLYSVH